MCAHPKSSSEVKNDWLVEAMHATVGSRNEEFGMRNGAIVNAECGMRSSDERTPQEHEPWRSVIGWW